MTAMQAIAIIVSGVLVPFVTAIASNPNQNANNKRAIVFVLSTALAVAVAIATEVIPGWGPVNSSYVTNILISLAGIVTIGQSIYSLFTPTIKRMESNGVDTDS